MGAAGPDIIIVGPLLRKYMTNVANTRGKNESFISEASFPRPLHTYTRRALLRIEFRREYAILLLLITTSICSAGRGGVTMFVPLLVAKNILCDKQRQAPCHSAISHPRYTPTPRGVANLPPAPSLLSAKYSSDDTAPKSKYIDTHLYLQLERQY